MAISKALGEAQSLVLIVDPYMDEKTLTDFAPTVPEGVTIHLLADDHSAKPSLAPAARRWAQQYGTTRPLSLRLAPPRTLHDRLIMADPPTGHVWIFTQSLNAFAARSPASVVRVDPETSALKHAAYQAIWNAGRVEV